MTTPVATTPTAQPATLSPPADVRRPPSTRRRLIAGALALASLATLVTTGGMLAQRVAAWNDTNDDANYAFIDVGEMEFEYAGERVLITDELDDDGAGEVIVAFGADERRFPVAVPNKLPLPGLDRHHDWLRIQIFADATGIARVDDLRAAINAGEVTPRLVITTRTPRAAATEAGRFELETPDEWGWGEVRRDRWLFTFTELLPGGGFREQSLRFPESGRSFYRRQIEAAEEGEPAPQRAPDELAEGTWQFQAALPLMNRAPAITMERQALLSAGWTLPVASGSVIVLIFSIAWFFAPDRVRDESLQAG